MIPNQKWRTHTCRRQYFLSDLTSGSVQVWLCGSAVLKGSESWREGGTLLRKPPRAGCWSQEEPVLSRRAAVPVVSTP